VVVDGVRIAGTLQARTLVADQGTCVKDICGLS
jgi:hypothetical protein